MMKYRIVFGEEIPVWMREFKTWVEASKFIKKHLEMGDRIFEVIQLDLPN